MVLQSTLQQVTSYLSMHLDPKQNLILVFYKKATGRVNLLRRGVFAVVLTFLVHNESTERGLCRR